MSVWTEVHCEMKFPEPVTAETLEKFFGKELKLKFISYNSYYDVVDDKHVFDKDAYERDCEEAHKQNEREWKAFDGHEDEYLPTGSEGSLHYVKSRRIARKTDDGRYKYTITGSLRDYADVEHIIKWFNRAFLGLILEHNDWNNPYGKVTASMGVGELIWRYGKE